LKLQSAAAAAAVVKVMHGRYFAGQMITARYLPASEYLARYPQAASAATTLPPPS
jgi:RNA-binding protein 39